VTSELFLEHNLFLAFKKVGRKLSVGQKNLSSAGPRRRKCVAVDLLMKGFLGFGFGFVGLFESTPHFKNLVFELFKFEFKFLKWGETKPKPQKTFHQQVHGGGNAWPRTC
jgi:hypothetical protein